MRVPRLYAIADAAAVAPTPVSEAVARFAAEGVGWIQVRAKHLPDAELHAELETAARLADGSGARLWVNDRPDLAAMLPLDGVHLGQEDLPPAVARTVVGETVWIGRSTHSAEQVAAAAADPAVDVVAVGPVFATSSKDDASPVVGLQLVRRARSATGKPIVAIGGIEATNARSVLEAGADAVAVLGAICSGDFADNLRRFRGSLGPLGHGWDQEGTG